MRLVNVSECTVIPSLIQVNEILLNVEILAQMTVHKIKVFISSHADDECPVMLMISILVIKF